jgi:hypothetical protein
VLAAGTASLRLAWHKGEIPSVPSLTMLEVGHQEPMGRPLSIEEMLKLLGEVDDHTRMLVLLLAGTLARPSALGSAR